MKKTRLFATLMSSLVLSACATYPSVGTSEGATPPRIVNKDGLMMWDNPGYFGPVPAEQMALGKQICSTLDTKDVKHEARGYHAKAQDIEGKTLPKGGFFCVPKG
jgi:hypothetical protein